MGEQTIRISYRSATTAALVIGFAIAACVFGVRTISSHEPPVIDGMFTAACAFASVAFALQWTIAYVEFAPDRIVQRTTFGRLRSKPLSSLTGFRYELGRDLTGWRTPGTSGNLRFSDGRNWYIPPGIANFDEFIRQVKHAVHMIETT